MCGTWKVNVVLEITRIFMFLGGLFFEFTNDLDVLYAGPMTMWDK